MAQSEFMNHLVGSMSYITIGIIAILLVTTLVKDGMEYAKGTCDIGKIIFKGFMLIVLVGGGLLVSSMINSMSDDPSTNTLVATESSTETEESEVVETVAEEPEVTETVTEQPTTEVATTETPTNDEQPIQEVTTTPITETSVVSSTELTDEEINTKWTYAVKHNYSFYYKDVNRNPDYIDKSLYRLEFDDTNRVVRLYDK